MSDRMDGFHEADVTEIQDEPGRHKPQVSTKRAILGALAGVLLLAAPLVIANKAFGGDDGKTDETAGGLIAAKKTTTTKAPTTTAKPTTTTAKPTTTAPPTTAAPKPAPTTAPPTTAAPKPTTTAAPSAPALPGNGGLGDPNLDATWDYLARCESGGNWAINTGNGFYGGIQFTLQSWQGVGGTGYPHQASRETQIAMGKRLWAIQGWGAWPGCTAKFGWR